MRIFVAGATGVLGRALLPELQKAGHEVIGLARTPEKLLAVDRLGAKAVRGDVLDAEGMRRLVQQAQPEAIVNFATAIPRKLRVHPRDWEMNDRVRREGTRNLLAAGREVGLRLFVQESVGYICPSQGDAWMEETAPYSTHSFLQATVEMERQVRASGLPFTLLRLAALISADSWHTQQSIAALRRGLLPIIAEGRSYLSLIHVEDAVRATCLALQQPEKASGETFHVVDEEPAQMRDVLPYAARLLHAPPPRQVPAMMAKMIVGALTVDVLTASYRMSGQRIRSALGFSPRYRSYREQWQRVAEEIGERDFAPAEDLSA